MAFGMSPFPLQFGSRGGGASPFSPDSLFAGGEAGGYFDLLDLSRLFQDTAGTTPVTTSGQTVGNLAFNGGGIVGVAPNDGARPTYVANAGYPYLDFSSSQLVTGNVDFSGVDEVTIILGLRKADNTTAIIVESGGNSNTEDGSFGLLNAASDLITFRSRGSSTSNASASGGETSPYTGVLTAQGDISTDTALNSINRTTPISSASDQGSGNYRNTPLYIGARSGNSLNVTMRLYSMIVIGRLLSASEILHAEQWTADLIEENFFLS